MAKKPKKYENVGQKNLCTLNHTSNQPVECKIFPKATKKVPKTTKF